MLNLITLEGTLSEREEVRYTPAGLEVFEGLIHYEGQQVQAGVARQLDCDMPIVAFGEMAHQLNAKALGVPLKIQGFLAPRSRRSRRLVIHVTEYI